MNSYDELTDLFQRHHVSQQQVIALHPLQQSYLVDQHARPQQQLIQSEPKPITYISQHYHHSTHAAPKQVTAPPLDTTINFVLANHGVDASTLSSAQMSLFSQGTTVQKMRLVELWRISPSAAGGHATNSHNWSETSFEREEELGRLRWESKMMEEAQAMESNTSRSTEATDDMMSDSEVSNAPVTPVLGQDGRWNQAGHVEPYMMSGYEALAAREYEASMQRGSGYARSADPVYKSIADIHHYPNLSIGQTGTDWCGQGDDDMML